MPFFFNWNFYKGYFFTTSGFILTISIVLLSVLCVTLILIICFLQKIEEKKDKIAFEKELNDVININKK